MITQSELRTILSAIKATLEHKQTREGMTTVMTGRLMVIMCGSRGGGGGGGGGEWGLDPPWKITKI